MLDSATLQIHCPKCGLEFIQGRSNQQYCSNPCQKAATRNASRGPRTVADSPEERLRQATRSNRLQNLSNAFFETPPTYRAEFMEKLIAKGRRNKELRRWLTNSDALGCRAHHRGTGRLHIAFCLVHYCREVYGMRSFAVLDPKISLPPEEKLAFPAQYFGPSEIMIYEDGSLTKRPCPWATRPKFTAVRPPSGAPLAAYDWRKIARTMRDHGWQKLSESNPVLEPEGADRNPPSTTIRENLNGPPTVALQVMSLSRRCRGKDPVLEVPHVADPCSKDGPQFTPKSQLNFG